MYFRKLALSALMFGVIAAVAIIPSFAASFSAEASQDNKKCTGKIKKEKWCKDCDKQWPKSSKEKKEHKGHKFKYPQFCVKYESPSCHPKKKFTKPGKC